MAYTEHDAADPLQRLADATAERDAYKTAVAQAIAEAAVTRNLGAEHAFAFASMFANRLRISIEGKTVVAEVLDASGHARSHVKDGRLVPFGLDDFAREIADRYADVIERNKDATAKPDGKPAQAGTLTAMSEAARAEDFKRRASENSAALARARARNPWNRETFNLTLQMQTELLDSQLARELKAAAGVVA